MHKRSPASTRYELKNFVVQLLNSPKITDSQRSTQHKTHPTQKSACRKPLQNLQMKPLYTATYSSFPPCIPDPHAGVTDCACEQQLQGRAITQNVHVSHFTPAQRFVPALVGTPVVPSTRILTFLDAFAE